MFVPLGILAPRLGFSDYGVFVLNCIAIIPLADVLCRATDAVSSYLGETGGALLNVTMGNATEVMILYVRNPFLHENNTNKYQCVSIGDPSRGKAANYDLDMLCYNVST